MNIQKISYEQILSDLDITILECLAQFHIENGALPEEVGILALKALLKIKQNKGNGTWCLLPMD